MTPEAAIDTLSSGSVTTILATCCVALAWTVRTLFRLLNESKDKRIEDLRDTGEKLANATHESNLALSALTEPLREAVRELRSRK